jgi:hypothetical protein
MNACWYQWDGNTNRFELPNIIIQDVYCLNTFPQTIINGINWHASNYYYEVVYGRRWVWSEVNEPGDCLLWESPQQMVV